MRLIARRTAKKMKKNVGPARKFDIRTTEVVYKDSKMRIIEPEHEGGMYCLVVNDKTYYYTLEDVLMMFVYFSLMYKGMDE